MKMNPAAAKNTIPRRGKRYSFFLSKFNVVKIELRKLEKKKQNKKYKHINIETRH